MAQLPDITDLVAGLYKAAADAAEWAEVWQAVAAYVGATSGSLYLEKNQTGAQSFLATPGWSVNALRLYKEHYHSVDHFAAFAKEKTNISMSVKLGPSVISLDNYRKSEIWNDFTRHHVEAFHLIGAAIPITDAISAKFALRRPQDGRAFGGKEQKFLEFMLKHIRSAFALHLRLKEDWMLSTSRASVLESITSGILVLDCNEKVVIHNAAGQHLGHSVGIRLGTTSRSARMDKRLTVLLRQVSDGGAGGKVLVRPEKEGPPVVVMVMPLPSNLPLRVDLGRRQNDLLTLILLRQQNVNRLPPNELMNLFDLTVAEAEVALALATGASPEEVAQARGRSIFTLRAQIRALLEKTDSSSLRELTNMVSSLNQLTSSIG